MIRTRPIAKAGPECQTWLRESLAMTTNRAGIHQVELLFDGQGPEVEQG